MKGRGAMKETCEVMFAVTASEDETAAVRATASLFCAATASDEATAAVAPEDDVMAALTASEQETLEVRATASVLTVETDSDGATVPVRATDSVFAVVMASEEETAAVRATASLFVVATASDDETAAVSATASVFVAATASEDEIAAVRGWPVPAVAATARELLIAAVSATFSVLVALTESELLTAAVRAVAAEDAVTRGPGIITVKLRRLDQNVIRCRRCVVAGWMNDPCMASADETAAVRATDFLLVAVTARDEETAAVMYVTPGTDWNPRPPPPRGELPRSPAKVGTAAVVKEVSAPSVVALELVATARKWTVCADVRPVWVYET